MIIILSLPVYLIYKALQHLCRDAVVYDVPYIRIREALIIWQHSAAEDLRLDGGPSHALDVLIFRHVLQELCPLHTAEIVDAVREPSHVGLRP